jgi:hypothetical protein
MGRRIVPVLIAIAAAAGCQPASFTFNTTATTSSSGSSAARAKGVKDALDAIAAGTLKLKEYPPLPSPAWQGEYIKLLKERCNVDYEVPQLPAGTSEADFREEVHGWNDTMIAEINKRFGADTVQKLQKEAQEKRNKK